MDLSTIQMHLDNFVNTWEGWNLLTPGKAGTMSLRAWIPSSALKRASLPSVT